MPNYIFHVGLPKTATTSLQTVFASLNNPSLIYNPFEIERAIELYFYHYISKGVFASSDEVLDHHGWNIDQIIARINETYREKSILVSTESLSYVPDRLCYLETVDFIAKYFGTHSVKIILIFRHQLEWMLSYYNHMVSHFGLTARFSEFYKHESGANPTVNRYYPPEFVLDDFGNHEEWCFSLDSLNYVDMVRTYENKFGTTNVLAFPFEELIRNSRQFSRRVCELTGDGNLSFNTESLPRELVGQNILTVNLIRYYCLFLKFTGVYVSSEARSRCELDRFYENESFFEAIKILPIYYYPKLVFSRLYKQRLIFCNVKSIRRLCRRIASYLPYIKGHPLGAQRESYSANWQEKNSGLEHYIEDSEVQKTYGRSNSSGKI